VHLHVQCLIFSILISAATAEVQLWYNSTFGNNLSSHHMCLGLGEELYSTSAITHIFTKRKCMVLVENSNE